MVLPPPLKVCIIQVLVVSMKRKNVYLLILFFYYSYFIQENILFIVHDMSSI